MTELLPQLGPRHPALGWIVGIEQGDHFAGMGDEGREALLDSVLRYVPTNLLLNAIRTRRGRKRGIPAMLLGVPYLYATVIGTTIVNGGGAGWLNLLVLLFFWNAPQVRLDRTSQPRTPVTGEILGAPESVVCC